MNKMKNKALGSIILLGTIGFLVVSIFRPIPCAATVVWKDNFDDGDFDGWTVQNGTFSAAGHSLQASNYSHNMGNGVKCSSSVAYGTWSFDVYINTTTSIRRDFIEVSFISNNQDGYYIHIWPAESSLYTDPIEIGLYKHSEGIPKIDDPNLGRKTYGNDLNGWQHIDVTRDTNGQFYGYVNGSLIFSGADNTCTSSTDLIFYTEKSGHALDNINVDNEVTISPGPTDLKFKDEIISVACEQNDSSSTEFYVVNEGEAAGSATFVAGTTPDGVTVTLDPSSITLQYNSEQVVVATIESSPTASPGNYTIDVELRDGSTVLDTLQMDVTISGTSEDSEDSAPGFLAFSIVFALGIIILFRRKRNY